MSGALLTADDVAGRLGHSADYWLRKARAKRIPHVRLGNHIRFTEDDVTRILDAARVEPVDPLRSQTSRSRSTVRRAS